MNEDVRDAGFLELRWGRRLSRWEPDLIRPSAARKKRQNLNLKQKKYLFFGLALGSPAKPLGVHPYTIQRSSKKAVAS